MSKDPRRLAVVIPCYNKVFYTQKTIESLIACTHSDLTIILVDDFSSDDTPAYCLELGGRMNQGETHFYVNRNTSNIGVNASWNTGLATAMAAEFPYICIANNDLLFTDGWDIPLLDAIDNEAYWLVSPYSTEQSLPTDWPQGSGRHTNPVSSAMNILGACFLFKADLIRKIGYFPAEMVHYFGDNWIQDMTRVYDFKTGHVQASYIHHFFCQTSKDLDNNYWFKKDGDAYNEYCRNFVKQG